MSCNSCKCGGNKGQATPGSRGPNATCPAQGGPPPAPSSSVHYAVVYTSSRKGSRAGYPTTPRVIPIARPGQGKAKVKAGHKKK